MEVYIAGQRFDSSFRLFALVVVLGAWGCQKPASKTPVPADTSTKAGSVSEKSDSKPGAGTAEEAGRNSPTADVQTAPDESKKEREELFVGWPQPRYVLLITGQQMGYIEPCGCTGLANQKGGLARRHTLAKQLAERGWPVVPVDVGNQVRRFGRQAELKFQITSEALKKIGYRAIALGADDLRLSVGELAAQTLAAEGQPSPFVSANAAVLEESLVPTHQVVEIAGQRVGITSVVSEEWQKKIIGSEILLKSPAAGLEETLPKIREEKCDLRILLAQASIDESRKLAQQNPDFQIVITAGGLGEPAYQPDPIPDSKALLIQVGLKGMFVGVLGVYDDPEHPFRYQRVPLDARFDDSADMLALLASYQDQLKSLGLEGLGLSPSLHPSGHRFVGSDKCAECHEEAFAVWKDSKHAHATDSLVHPTERSEIARHFDPECLSCHVTGWNPQQYQPYDSGYLSLDKTPLMTGSGCENCHGPGSAHVAAEEGEGSPSQEQLKTLRESLRLPLAQAEKKCQECHDLDNSPDFHAPGAFEKYWKQVAH